MILRRARLWKSRIRKLSHVELCLWQRIYFFSIIFCPTMRATLISVARFGRKIPDYLQVSSSLQMPPSLVTETLHYVLKGWQRHDDVTPKTMPKDGSQSIFRQSRNLKAIKIESHLVQAQTQQSALQRFLNGSTRSRKCQLGLRSTKGTHLIFYIKVSLKSSPRQKTLAGHRVLDLSSTWKKPLTQLYSWERAWLLEA